MSLLAAIIAHVSDYSLLTKLLISFFAGLIPVLLWLWFWEHEDKHPEPKKLILLAFVAGMVGVALTLPLEQMVADLNLDLGITIFLWAAIEELVKFSAAFIAVLMRAENDEPIDSMMYMITTALGFAALENMLFLFTPISTGHTAEALMTGDLRFVGATLLHTITSGIIGLALSLTFYRSKHAKRIYVTIGVITAIVLHAFFNLSIILFNGSKPIIPFYAVWVAIVLILLAFEKVKNIKQPLAKP